MSKFMIFDYKNNRYIESLRPPQHDHWHYDHENDIYYEDIPNNYQERIKYDNHEHL